MSKYDSRSKIQNSRALFVTFGDVQYEGNQMGSWGTILRFEDPHETRGLDKKNRKYLMNAKHFEFLFLVFQNGFCCCCCFFCFFANFLFFFVFSQKMTT